MTETSEHTPTEQELSEVIAEFEEYRERLISQTLATAQKAKVMKATALAQLEPELAKIDAVLKELRDSVSASARIERSLRVSGGDTRSVR